MCVVVSTSLLPAFIFQKMCLRLLIRPVSCGDGLGPVSCGDGLDWRTALCFLLHPIADPCLRLLCFKSPCFLPLVRNLAALQRMFRRDTQVRITLHPELHSISPQPLPSHVTSVGAVGCQAEEGCGGSWGLIDMPFRLQTVPGIQPLSPGSGGRGSKNLPPWQTSFSISLVSSLASVLSSLCCGSSGEF